MLYILLGIISMLGILAVINYTNSSMVLELRMNNILFKEIGFLSGVYIISALISFYLNRYFNIYKFSFTLTFILIILTSVAFSIKSQQVILFASVSLFAIPCVFLAGILYCLKNRNNIEKEIESYENT